MKQLLLILVCLLVACGAESTEPTPTPALPPTAVPTKAATPTAEPTMTQTTFTPISVPETAAASPLAERVEQHVADLNDFRGVILLAENGVVTLAQGVGSADEATNHPITPQTIFDIGSITKQFTGAAILRLEMDGKLSVNDPVSDYISDAPPEWADMTIHHLLTHTAGFRDALGDDYQPINRADYLDKAKTTRLNNPVGETHSYSNVGYSILAAIIEIAAEQPYETYLRDALFLPAGMENTGYILPDWSTATVATGYRRGRDQGKPHELNWADDGPYWNLKGNGGILSSAEDMYRWHLALLDNTILDTAAKTKFYARHVSEGPGMGSYYGYGWVNAPLGDDKTLITHNGGNGIFFADFLRFLDHDITILVMTNATNRNADRLAGQIGRMALDPEFQPTLRNDTNQPATTEFPATPLAQTVNMLLEVLKNGDDATKQAFVEENYAQELRDFAPMEDHLAMMTNFGNEIADLTIAQITIPEDDLTLAITLADPDGNSTLELYFEAPENNPAKLIGINVEG